MLLMLQITCVVLISISMALSLAHALELPGKLRLSKDEYLIVQKIYYPGFTIGGFGEVLGMAALLALLLFTASGNLAFGWTLASLAALAITHGAYWVLTHPVNKFWLKDLNLEGLGKSFFGSVAEKEASLTGGNNDDLWNRYRNRWELSHVIRAVFAMLSLVLLVVAITAEGRV